MNHRTTSYIATAVCVVLLLTGLALVFLLHVRRLEAPLFFWVGYWLSVFGSGAVAAVTEQLANDESSNNTDWLRGHRVD